MPSLNCKICGKTANLLLKDLFDDRHGCPGRFDIYRCHACGFCQTIPEIPEDRIGDLYTQYYPRQKLGDPERLKNQPVNLLPAKTRWLEGLDNTAHYHIHRGTRVLDIGCGDCTSIREINAMGAEGYGIEPDRNIKPIVEALGLKVHIGLFHEIPYQDNFFDYITMSQVLEHIPDPVELLKSLRHILKDGGQVIIGVPNVDSWTRKKYGARWLHWHVPYHINHFSRRSLYTLAEKSGYRVVKVLTRTPNLWVTLQEKMLKFPVGEGVRVPFFNLESDYQEPPAPPPARPGSFRHLAVRLKAKTAHWKARHLISRLKASLKDSTTSGYDWCSYMSQCILLRAVDLAGGGESYLVFLEKKHKSVKITDGMS